MFEFKLSKKFYKFVYLIIIIFFNLVLKQQALDMAAEMEAYKKELKAAAEAAKSGKAASPCKKESEKGAVADDKKKKDADAKKSSPKKKAPVKPPPIEEDVEPPPPVPLTVKQIMELYSKPKEKPKPKEPESEPEVCPPTKMSLKDMMKAKKKVMTTKVATNELVVDIQYKSPKKTAPKVLTPKRPSPKEPRVKQMSMNEMIKAKKQAEREALAKAAEAPPPVPEVCSPKNRPKSPLP